MARFDTDGMLDESFRPLGDQAIRAGEAFTTSVDFFYDPDGFGADTITDFAHG